MASPDRPPLILALDTAGEACGACLLAPDGGRVLAALSTPMARGHAEALFPMIAAVLAEARARPGDLTHVAVSVGPGSFTGVRVGLAAAKGLGLSLGLPVMGVSSLEALAARHFGRGLPVLAVHDAKRGEVFAALFDAAGATIAPPRALTADELPAMAGAAPRMILVGSAAPLAAKALAGRIVEADPRPVPDPADIARLAAASLDDPAARPPLPLYLRGADAKPQTGFAVARA